MDGTGTASRREAGMIAAPMSALLLKADMDRHAHDVRFVPKADICSAANSSLFDHLVGAWLSSPAATPDIAASRR